MRPPPLTSDASALTRTLVVGSVAAPHEAGKSLIYCSAFALAWQKLMGFTGGALRLMGSPPLAGWLNEEGALEVNVDEPSYLACVGRGADGILETIRAELAQRFPGVPATLLPASLPANGILAFAHLSKRLVYAVPFAYSDHGLRFEGVPVAGFGVWREGSDGIQEARRRQVLVHDYRGPSDFVIELRAGDGQDQIIVARAPPAETLGETIRLALSRRDRLADTPDVALGHEDELVVGCLDFRVLRSFEELVGRPVQNPSLSGYSLDEARQNVHFTFDEQGAVVDSQAAIACFGLPPSGRTFLCNGPFLVLLLRRGHPRPYLAVWVENRELLLAASP
ncbi:MAG: hypothetical protein JW751_02905 [Polyangiaceae bacterium]|nr:hypothetical protein [Polyangiaceae bacterium]